MRLLLTIFILAFILQGCSNDTEVKSGTQTNSVVNTQKNEIKKQSTFSFQEINNDYLYENNIKDIEQIINNYKAELEKNPIRLNGADGKPYTRESFLAEMKQKDENGVEKIVSVIESLRQEKEILKESDFSSYVETDGASQTVVELSPSEAKKDKSQALTEIDERIEYYNEMKQDIESGKDLKKYYSYTTEEIKDLVVKKQESFGINNDEIEKLTAIRKSLTGITETIKNSTDPFSMDEILYVQNKVLGKNLQSDRLFTLKDINNLVNKANTSDGVNIEIESNGVKIDSEISYIPLTDAGEEYYISGENYAKLLHSRNNNNFNSFLFIIGTGNTLEFVSGFSEEKSYLNQLSLNILSRIDDQTALLLYSKENLSSENIKKPISLFFEKILSEDQNSDNLVKIISDNL